MSKKSLQLQKAEQKPNVQASSLRLLTVHLGPTGRRTLPLSAGQLRTAGTLQVEVLIIGGGVAGLMCAMKLSKLGYRVALVEKETRVATASSIKNEGWLHHGTYHSVSICDADAALRVAKKCIYGSRQIREYAPEAIEQADEPVIAYTSSTERAAMATERWISAGVQFAPVTLEALRKLVPTLKTENIQAAFRVADCAIDTRILYRKLLAECLCNGVLVLTDSQAHFETHLSGVLAIGDQTVRFKTELVLAAAGYGIPELYRSAFGENVPLRFWASHLCIAPPLVACSSFSLDAKEAAMINHSSCTIVGQNEDATEVHGPIYRPRPECIASLREAIGRAVTAVPIRVQPVVCTKVDIPRDLTTVRSLDTSLMEPVPGHLCVLPGKMTEAPFVADLVCRAVYDRLPDKAIGIRPCDLFAQSECA